MEVDTLWRPLLGGAVTGLAAALLWLLNGRVLGVSGILGGLIIPPDGGRLWRAMFLLGLLMGGLVVMVGAIAVYALAQRAAKGLSKPIVSQSFVGPPSRRIDGRLVVGSIIFGVGWGLAGYCPGPAVVSAAAGSGQAVLFVAAMAAGLGVVRVWDERLGKASSEP